MAGSDHAGGSIAPDHQLALLEMKQQLARYEDALARTQQQARAPMDEDDDIIDLRQLWSVLVRRRWTIAITTLLIVLVAGIATALMTPIYRATTVVQIELDSGNVLQYEEVQAEETYSSKNDFYQTQYELLKSRALAARVIDRLGLQYQNTEPTPKGMVATLRESLAELFGAAPEAMDDEVAAIPPDLESGFLANLTIEPVRNSRLVRIHYDSTSAQQASIIVNAVASAYVDMNLERRFEASTYAKSFLDDRIKQVRADLEDSERRFQAYTQERGIVDQEDKQGILMTRLRSLNAAAVEAEAERIAAESQYQEMLSTTDESLALTLDSQIIERLKEQRAQIQQEYQQAAQLYKPGYPLMLQLQEQIDQINADIETEVVAIRDGIRARYQAKLREEIKLLESIEMTKAEILNLNSRSTDFQALKREVDTNRELYDGLLQRMKEVGVAAGIATNNIAVVDKAQTPRGRFKPNLSRNLLLALVLGLFAGGGLALLFEMLDDTIKSTADLERLVDRPILGVTPMVAEGDAAEIALMSYLEPTSGIAEAMRSMRTGLALSSAEGAPKILHFTSTSPGEGKTTTAVNTAINFAQTGSRVLLIDADLRNPSLHKIFNKPNDVGLSNYLTADATPAGITQATGVDNLFLASSGPVPPNPAELLHGAKLFDLVALAKERFDYVVIDGPPLLGLADALLLADVAKATLFVVAANSARRGGVEAGMKRLQQARANVLGMVLSKYDITRANYGYGYGYGYSYNYAYQYSYGGKPESDPADRAA